MPTQLEQNLLDAKKDLEKAIAADGKKPFKDVHELYKDALDKYSVYIEALKGELQPHYKRADEIKKRLNPGWLSPTNSSYKLSDVGGLDNCKKVLEEAAIWPKKYPQMFTGNRKPWRAVLLFGPPGTGKTLLAKAIAAEAKFNFFSISPSNIVSKWMGESEQRVSDLFQEARRKEPSIIFIDEIDSLCGPRGENNENEASRRIKSELLVHMQGVCDGEKNVLILAATNTPYALDQAIRRRFDMRIYIPLPNNDARKRIFEVEIGKTPSMIGKSELKDLVEKTDGFSGSDISYYVKDALYQSIRATLKADSFITDEDNKWVPCINADNPHKKSLEQLDNEKQNSEIRVPKIKLDDFNEVRNRHKPTVKPADVARLEKFEEEFGLSGSK